MIRKKPEREDPFTIIDYHTPDIVSSVIFQFVRKFFGPSSRPSPGQLNQRKTGGRSSPEGKEVYMYEQESFDLHSYYSSIREKVSTQLK